MFSSLFTLPFPPSTVRRLPRCSPLSEIGKIITYTNSAAKESPCASRGLFTNHVIEIKLAKPRTRLRDSHENNHEREQHQRLDEGQTQNQRHLNASPRRRIASERFARRRRHAPLAQRRQPGCDGDRETRSDCHPVSRTRCACARLRKRRDSQDREHYHHEQQHHDFPHFSP